MTKQSVQSHQKEEENLKQRELARRSLKTHANEARPPRPGNQARKSRSTPCPAALGKGGGAGSEGAGKEPERVTGAWVRVLCSPRGSAVQANNGQGGGAPGTIFQAQSFFSCEASGSHFSILSLLYKMGIRTSHYESSACCALFAKLQTSFLFTATL